MLPRPTALSIQRSLCSAWSGLHQSATVTPPGAKKGGEATHVAPPFPQRSTCPPRPCSRVTFVGVSKLRLGEESRNLRSFSCSNVQCASRFPVMRRGCHGIVSPYPLRTSSYRFCGGGNPMSSGMISVMSSGAQRVQKTRLRAFRKENPSPLVGSI